MLLTDYERAALRVCARHFASGQAWLDYVRERAQTQKWIVALRLTSRLRNKGYDRAIHPDEFARWEVDYGLPRLCAALDQLRREDAPL
jgi:hypothetical protein